MILSECWTLCTPETLEKVLATILNFDETENVN